MQTNKLSYAGAGSEIDSRGHKKFHWQMGQIRNIYLSWQFRTMHINIYNALLVKLFNFFKHYKSA